MSTKYHHNGTHSLSSPNEVKIFAGNSHPELAAQIAECLKMKLSKAEVGTFSNGETCVTIGESVRDCDVFIVQSTCVPKVNDYLIELLIMSDAMRRASARRVTAVIPHYGYARQDKKEKSRAPITGKLVANLIETAGVDRVITVDLHASQIQGFFDIPVDNLFAEKLLMEYIQSNILANFSSYSKDEVVIVSPDAGGVKRAKAVSDKLDVDLAIISKERKRSNEVSSMTLVGNVAGKVAIIVDDMADTCGTLKNAANVLQQYGAKEVYAAVTHPVLSGKAIQVLENSAIKELVCTNTIPLSPEARQCPKIKTLDIGPMLAEAVSRTHNGESISVLFN